MILLLTAAGVVGCVGVLLRRRLLVVTVEGVSMEPAYRPGDRLLVRRAGLAGVRRGAAVLVASPPGAGSADPPFMVKRAAALPGDPVPAGFPVPDAAVPPGRLLVLGDNAARSADSRTMGYLSADDVIGVVLRRLPR
ncbi:S26 family signal peptidase [Actinoplanes philippinensis]|uniref:signal peptidase I n=1 Tax=Actinoplanes philippinensis TaxID=35752 RepID=A0A1I2I7F6_9ACTN|nr:S26 family signal peptidase [Actinoplanes philippinensis]GIE78701.1 S26 family signal peptidase [Actinoplanes philippinensis]SFF36471.1 signal peptidase I [Actinoplanes philippinensis]